MSLRVKSTYLVKKMASKIKKKSLADKINSLVSTTPTNFDSDDDAEDTRAKVVDHYDESDNSVNNFQVSEIRRRNVDLLDQLDERYKGKKISRKDMYSEDDGPDNSTDDDDDNDDEEEKDEDVDEDEDEEVEVTEEDEDEEEEDEIDSMKNEESYNDTDSNNEDVDNESIMSSNNDSNINQKINFQTMSSTNLRADIEKGNCARNQLKLWENLLEVRIKLQKCLVTSNQMPQHNVYKNFKKDVEYMKKAHESKNKLKILLNNMLQLQSVLLKQYPETMNLCTESRKRKAEESIDNELLNADDSMDEEIPSDTEDENNMDEKLVLNEDTGYDTKNMFNMQLKLSNYETIINNNHKSYTNYRDSVIQKWNEKTKIASGKLNKNTNQTTLKQIEFMLSDKEKLYKRTQLRRSEYNIIGKKEPLKDKNEDRGVQEYDSEIYDDDDFYHQLLRDLIEHKSTDITDPIQLSKQWIQLQNMRSKMKRKIDTRATKGRRIRYNVHNKLVNFMAPITINDTWTDQAKDELYSSLFGKIKSVNEHTTH
nr:protein AATF [Nomia melanderi]